jgi:hypothetical protein
VLSYEPPYPRLDKTPHTHLPIVALKVEF